MTNKLAGKIAVVTGASEGIGKACALEMLKAGAQVVLVGRNTEKLKSICQEWGDAAIPFTANLLTKRDRDGLIPGILEKVDHIDIFQANAGVYADGFLTDHTDQQIEDIIDLNVKAVMFNVRDVLKHMAIRGEGHIVVTNSMAAVFATPSEPIYMSSKWAVDGFVRNLQETVPEGIKVSQIMPASTRTALSESWSPERQALEAGRTMAAETVANATMYILTAPEDALIRNIEMAPPSFRFHAIPVPVFK